MSTTTTTKPKSAQRRPSSGSAPHPAPGYRFPVSGSIGSDTGAPLFDDEWSAFIGAVIADDVPAALVATGADPTPAPPQSTAATAAYLASLHDGVSSGLRRKFTLVTRQELFEWVADTAKSSASGAGTALPPSSSNGNAMGVTFVSPPYATPAAVALCKEASSIIESAPRTTPAESVVPDSLVAKLLRLYLYKVRIDSLEARRIAREAAATALAAAASAASAGATEAIDPKTGKPIPAAAAGGSTAPNASGGNAGSSSPAAAAGGAGAQAGKDVPKSAAKKGGSTAAAAPLPSNAKDAKSEANNSATDNQPKAKGKLRDRAAPKVKVTPIDDEPVDGPDTYLVLANFASVSLLETLAADGMFPLHAITSLTHIPPTITPSAPGAFSLETHTTAPLSPCLASLYSRLFATCPSTNVLLTSVSCQGLSDGQAAFDAVAKTWYALLGEQREYTSFFAARRVISLPPPASGHPTADHGAADPETEEITKAIKDVVDRTTVDLMPLASLQPAKSGGYRFPPAPAVHSRAEPVIGHIPGMAGTDNSGSRLAQLAKAANQSQALTGYYLDLVQMESMASRRSGHPVDCSPFVWAESLSTVNAVQHLESVFASSSTQALTATRTAPSPALMVVSTGQPPSTQDEKCVISPARRLGLCAWHRQRVSGTSVATPGYVYDPSTIPVSALGSITSESKCLDAEVPTTAKSDPSGHKTVVIEGPGDVVLSLSSSLDSSSTNSLCLATHDGLTLVATRIASLSPSASGEALQHVKVTTALPTQITLSLISTPRAEGMSAASPPDVHLAYPPHHLIRWRRILGSQTGDQVVAFADGHVHYLRHDGVVGIQSDSADSVAGWMWTTMESAVQETDPASGRQLWCREEDGTRAVRFVDGGWMTKFADGTLIRTQPQPTHRQRWACNVPQLGEVEWDPAPVDGTGARIALAAENGARVSFNLEDQGRVQVSLTTGQEYAILLGSDAQLEIPGAVVDLARCAVDPVPSKRPTTERQLDCRPGKLARSLVSSSFCSSLASNTPQQPGALLALRPALQIWQSAHTRYWTDQEVRQQLLRAMSSVHTRVQVAEEALVSADSNGASSGAAAVPVVLTVVEHDTVGRAVQCRHLVRFPAMTEAIRADVWAAWKLVMQSGGISPSGADAGAATEDRTAAEPVLLTEADILARYQSAADRHQLLKAQPDRTLHPWSSVLGAPDPGSHREPHVPNFYDPLLSRPPMAAIRYALTPVRASLPVASQVKVHLSDSIRAIDPAPVPYFASEEGKAALAGMSASAKSLAASAASPRRTISGSSSPPLPTFPIYSSGRPIDLQADLIGGVDAVLVASADAADPPQPPNPFAKGPKLVPRLNRASVLRGGGAIPATPASTQEQPPSAGATAAAPTNAKDGSTAWTFRSPLLKPAPAAKKCAGTDREASPTSTQTASPSLPRTRLDLI